MHFTQRRFVGRSAGASSAIRRQGSPAWRLVALLVMACTVAVIGADQSPDELPKSRDARRALEKFDNARTKAKKEYDAAVGQAVRTAEKELSAAKLSAMQSGDLEEANRIQAVSQKLDELAARPEAAEGQPLEAMLVDTAWADFGSPKFPVERRWIRLNKDGTTSVGFNDSVGLWVVRANRVMVIGGGYPTMYWFEFSPDRKTVRWSGGNLAKRVNPKQ